MAAADRYKPPDWQPNIAEALVEAAVTLPPNECYPRRLFDSIGAPPNSQLIAMLVNKGMLEYTGEVVRTSHGGIRKLMVVPAEAAPIILEAVQDRMGRLAEVSAALKEIVERHIEIEPFYPGPLE